MVSSGEVTKEQQFNGITIKTLLESGYKHNFVAAPIQHCLSYTEKATTKIGKLQLQLSLT